MNLVLLRESSAMRQTRVIFDQFSNEFLNSTAGIAKMNVTIMRKL